jgi:hypothetical protein
MTNLTTEAGRRRAARFAANFASWKRKAGVPAPFPRDMRPLSVSTVPELLKPPPTDAGEDEFRAVTRNCVAASLATSGLDEVARQMVKAREWDEFQAKRAEKHSNWCTYCSLCEACEKRVHKNKVRGDVKKENHAPVQMQFDADSLIASAWVTNRQVKLTTKQLEELAFAADPRNWRIADPDFFHHSDPIRRKRNGQWEPDDSPWGVAGGYIYEDVCWTINDVVDGEARNILRISQFHNPFTVWQPGDVVPGLPPDTREAVLSYDYALEETTDLKLFAGWEPGGLDVDGGFYKLEAERAAAGDRWLVSVSVLKKARYIPVATSIPEVMTMMNFMAPALLQMLVGNLVNEGIERLKSPERLLVRGRPSQ